MEKINYLNILTLDDLQNLDETKYNEIKTIGEVFKKVLNLLICMTFHI